MHVLVEKPLAASLADCDAMLAAAKRAGVLLGVISQRRFYEPVRRMKEAIDAGKIGRPALGLFTMYSWREQANYQSDPWRGKWDTKGGGVGSHDAGTASGGWVSVDLVANDNGWDIGDGTLKDLE